MLRSQVLALRARCTHGIASFASSPAIHTSVSHAGAGLHWHPWWEAAGPLGVAHPGRVGHPSARQCPSALSLVLWLCWGTASWCRAAPGPGAWICLYCHCASPITHLPWYRYHLILVLHQVHTDMYAWRIHCTKSDTMNTRMTY